jgi:hypothetical protein
MATLEGPTKNENKTEGGSTTETKNPLESATIGGSEQHKASDYLEQHRHETGQSLRAETHAPDADKRLSTNSDQATDKVMRNDALQTPGGGALPEKGPAKMEDDSKKKPQEIKPDEKKPDEKKPEEKRIEPHDAKPPEIRGKDPEKSPPDSKERLGTKEKNDETKAQGKGGGGDGGDGGDKKRPEEAALEKKVGELKERKAELESEVKRLDEKVEGMKAGLDPHKNERLDNHNSKLADDLHNASREAISARKELSSTKVQLFDAQEKLDAMRKQNTDKK